MKNNLQILEHAVPLGSLDAYTQWVNQVPMLSQEEEYELATRFRRTGDLDAARRLVLAHLRFVVHVAKNYFNYGLAQADLIQEGTIGLMKAVKHFDPDRNVRLVSFAVYWIKAEIHEFIIRNWRIVRIATTKAQRKLFFNLRKIKNQIGCLGQLSDQETLSIAKNLRVKPEEVANMEMRFSQGDLAFDGNVDEDDDYSNAPANYLTDQSANPAHIFEKENSSDTNSTDLQKALASLDARSQDIIRQRWLKNGKVTLQDLANKYSISVERIRQIEECALRKLRQTLPSLQAV
ncbi:MAG: RNA polymerase sigma factor RpoH [Gammaproteobacteria bacterium]